MRRRITTLLFCIAFGWLTSAATAQEPGWSGPVLATGAHRAQIEATPIEHRSYRPFHFYGNTIRRLHYRGYALPRPRDVFQGTVTLVREPVR
jgi:hypothetical protein